MVECKTVPPDNIKAFIGETPVSTVTTGSVVDIYVNFPEYYPGYEWKLFDKERGKLTDTILLLDENGCGKYTAQFAQGSYNLYAEVCGIWYGDTCMSIISKSMMTKNTLSLDVVEAPPVVKPPSGTCDTGYVKLPYFGCVKTSTAILYAVGVYGGLYLVVRSMNGKSGGY